MDDVTLMQWTRHRPSRGQSAIEVMVGIVVLAVLFWGLAQMWSWMDRTIVERNREYQNSRYTAGQEATLGTVNPYQWEPLSIFTDNDDREAIEPEEPLPACEEAVPLIEAAQALTDLAEELDELAQAKIDEAGAIGAWLDRFCEREDPTSGCTYSEWPPVEHPVSFARQEYECRNDEGKACVADPPAQQCWDHGDDMCFEVNWFSGCGQNHGSHGHCRDYAGRVQRFVDQIEALTAEAAELREEAAALRQEADGIIFEACLLCGGTEADCQIFRTDLEE
jgi:hypothetical protein